MPPVRSLKKIPIHVWIPPSFDVIHKVEIEKSNGTIYDVTDLVLDGDFTYGVTDTIGNMTLDIDNSSETYTGLFELYDEVNLYLDYASTATTLVFKGFIEKRSYNNNRITIKGRSTATRVMGITVTQSFENQYTHTIIESLIDTYAPYITKTNIDTTESTDSLVTINFYQKSFWECIVELCNRAGYDAYIDANLDFHYFVSNSQINETEAIVHEYNLIETGDFAPDLSTVRNKVMVYGAEVKGQQIVWTELDQDSIDLYDVKELIIKDTNIVTVSQAEAKAIIELSTNKDPPIVGEIVSLCLPTLLPGQQLRISDPLNGLAPSTYSIRKFVHTVSNDEPIKTTVTIEKETRTIPKILKGRIIFETDATSKENPNELNYSWIYDFNTDVGTHTRTEIVDGVLKLQDGETDGVWISELNTRTSVVTEAEMRATGTSLAGTNYYVSPDNGVTWQQINSLSTVQNMAPPGLYLKLKVEINSANTGIESLGLLYK